MNDVLHNIIQALEKLVMHGGATTNGMVPALISQAQDDLARAKAGLAASQGEPVAATEVVEAAYAGLPPPVPGTPSEPAPVPEAPVYRMACPPADPAPEEAASDQTADALNAAEEQGIETAAPTTTDQPPAS